MKGLSKALVSSLINWNCVPSLLEKVGQASQFSVTTGDAFGFRPFSGKISWVCKLGQTQKQHKL